MLNRALITLFLICASQLQSFAQVLGVPLYSWDFAGGLPATWTNGSTSNIGVWEYRGPNTVPSNAITSRGSCAGGSSAFNSVTQSNGFMIFDSNYWDDNDNQCGGFGTGLDPGPHTAWLISNSFSLAGVTGAVVTYQQQFRNYSSTIKVQYSINNGTTWIDMVSQSDFPGATAEWKSATFPATAIGQTNVKLRFLYSGSYYHWAIDDITVYKPSINNLSINNTRYTTFGNTSPVPPNDFHDLPYDRYPKTMLVPFKFSAKATNIGSATQTNTNLNVKVLNSANTALYNQTTANSNVTAGSTATYTLATGFTPSTTTGYYRITYQVNQTQTDESPLNNRDTLDYFVTDYQYARDEGPMEDEFTPSALYAGQPYQVGNIFQGRSSTIKCASVAVAVGPGTSIGTTIEAKIYKTDFTLLASSSSYTVNAWDINALGQQKLITLPLTTPLTLTADSLYIVMVGNTNGSQAFKVCRSGAALDQTSFVRYPQSNGLFFMAKMPVVRMNLFTAAQTPGCMNAAAINYNASANIDDGSCDIPGCIYPTASNYNANATWYDGSCVVNGCTNPAACNYNPLATVNNGSCILPTTYFADADGDTFGNAGSSTSACSQPTGYVTNSTDCNDSNASIRPTATEICNGLDDNCNGSTDEGFAFTNYYVDSDNDGYGAGSAIASCTALGSGYSTNNLDCNNSNANIRPNASETCNSIDDNCNGSIDEGLTFVNYYVDTDLDGFGAGSAVSSCTVLTGNFVTNNFDCNNNNANIKPTASEICNSIDDNCNGLIDDGLTFLGYYLDTDGDGFGAGTGIIACSSPGSGYVTNNTDCNNSNPNIRPNATEVCNGIDDNCNNLIDDGLTFVNYYIDTDFDGYGAGIATNSCTPLGSNYATNNLDCNNNNANIRPNAAEVCNGIDDNCNNIIDDGLTFVNYYIDTDLDGYGAGTATNSCSVLGSNYVTNNTDCNNNNPNIRPNAVETCNNIDDNCNNSIDEGLVFVNYYLDTDGDGFGAGNAINSCTPLGTGYATQGGDCDNSNSSIRPGATEICNSVDDNCNTLVDEGLSFITYYLDADIDGYYLSLLVSCLNPGANYTTNGISQGDCNDNNSNINPGASEICGNSIDENCDGTDPVCIVPGCTNPIASNYNPAANLENGSCIILGCTIANANNFNPNANTDDGSCIFLGCTDPFANNFNPIANTNDFSCEYNTAAVSVSDNELCLGESVIAYNQTQYSVNDSCSIDFGDGTVLNYCAPTYSHTYATSGIYTVALFHFQGSEFSTASANPIQVNPTPTQAILTYTYPEISIPNFNANEMSWVFNGVSTGISEQTINAVDNYSEDGFYQVVSLNEFGCQAISDSLYFIIPKFDVFQESPCGPNTITFVDITQSSQNLICAFENSNVPNAQFISPYSYLSVPPESIDVTLVCSAFGNIYYSSETGAIETYSLPETPVLTYTSPIVESPNVDVNNATWMYQGNILASGNINALNLSNSNGIQNGTYSIFFTNQYGCNSDTSEIFIIDISASATITSGCAPLSTTLINHTSLSEGIQCEILLPGLDYVSFDSNINYTFDSPGVYTPTVYCYAGTFSNTYTLDSIVVFDHPIAPQLTSAPSFVSVTNNSSGYSVQWFLDGNTLNSSSNSLATLTNGIYDNGYYAVQFTDSNGCATLSSPLLVLQPQYEVLIDSGCSPLTATLVNTTDPVNGMTCTLNNGIGGSNINFNSEANLSYSDSGTFAPEMTCSVGNLSFTYSANAVTVFPNPVTPVLSSTYGTVTCLNCSSDNQFFLDNSPFAAGIATISTLQNGVYQNGYYSASYVDSNGCSSARDSILVIQPNFEAIQFEGCSPLTATLLNTTDPVNGMLCSINDGNGGAQLDFNSTVNLSYLETGNFAPEITCSVGLISSTYSDTVITVHPAPEPSTLSYSNGFIQANNLPNTSDITWFQNGTSLGTNSNPLNIGNDQLSGYFYGTITNEFGCYTNTDTLLQIFPTFTLDVTSGCYPLTIHATNTTPAFDGMNCVLQTNNTDYPLNNFNSLNYAVDGLYSTSITCTLDGNSYTVTGPTVTVFPNAPTPQLSATYGTVICANCAGISTQYFLDDIAFAQGTTTISTLQNGIYHNGNYTAQATSNQGCLSQISSPILVIQPVLNFTPGEGCAPLQVSFVNNTDYIDGLSCELFLGNGNGNIPISYLESYNYSYSNSNTYAPYLSCTVENTVANSPSASLIVNGGTTPDLIFDAGFVTCTNCANQDNITWIIDGTLTIDSISSVANSLGSFFSCDYINEFGCTANSFIVSVIDENVSTFNLFPNPVKDQLNISGLSQTSTLEIHDAQGRLVFQELGRGTSRTINTSDFSNGFYTITETSSKLFRSGTLLVIH